MEEQKMVEIKPLPEQKEAPAPIKKKRGRKPNPNKKPKTGEKHVMTEARKQGLLKARLAKAEKRKKRLAEQAKALEEAKGKESQAQLPAQRAGNQDAVLNRLGQLEQSLTSLTTSMEQLLKVGTFKGSRQAEQTTPQLPTELRQADIMRSEESFVRRENGGQSVQEVRPDPDMERLTQNDRRNQRRTAPKGFIF